MIPLILWDQTCPCVDQSNVGRPQEIIPYLWMALQGSVGFPLTIIMYHARTTHSFIICFYSLVKGSLASNPTHYSIKYSSVFSSVYSSRKILKSLSFKKRSSWVFEILNLSFNLRRKLTSLQYFIYLLEKEQRHLHFFKFPNFRK